MKKSMMTKSKQYASEVALKKLKRDFIITIPQLQKVVETQKRILEVQQKRAEKIYPFINTQAFSTA